MSASRCLVALYFVGADKPALQGALVAAGAIPPVVRLCHSTQREVQAEAVDVLKVLSRHQRASRVIVDLGETLHCLKLLIQRVMACSCTTRMRRQHVPAAAVQDANHVTHAS